MKSENRYDIIACDLDGTLLNSSSRLSERNIAALRRAYDAGIKIIIASGRPPRAATWVLDRIGIPGLVIASGGGCVVEHPSGKLLVHHSFASRETVRRIARYHRGIDSRITAMCVSDYYYEKMSPDEERALVNYMQYDGIETDLVTCDIDFDKCDIILPSQERIEQVAKDLRELVGDEAVVLPAAANAIDINPKGIDKSNALIEAAAALGSDISRVVAFGDSANDVGMLKAAGLGVCMANGFEAAHAAADITAPSNDEDGVAETVERIVFSCD